MWGYHFWGMHFGWWIFLILLTIWILIDPGGWLRRRGSGESAIDILKKRYARGEISKEEYLEKKKELES